jgi:hypothetical protein
MENTGIVISKEEMQERLTAILLKEGFTEAKAVRCAEIFTMNSIDGVYTHGINRFPRFVKYIKDGFVKKDAEPTLQHAFGSIEQWNGNLGPGPLNAEHATNPRCVWQKNMEWVVWHYPIPITGCVQVLMHGRQPKPVLFLSPGQIPFPICLHGVHQMQEWVTILW